VVIYRKRKKSSLQCHAILCERTDSLRALDSVAGYLENNHFHLINDNIAKMGRKGVKEVICCCYHLLPLRSCVVGRDAHIFLVQDFSDDIEGNLLDLVQVSREDMT
jgi:hypothetical protein